jgi:hypothetical protein
MKSPAARVATGHDQSYAPQPIPAREVPKPSAASGVTIVAPASGL